MLANERKKKIGQRECEENSRGTKSPTLSTYPSSVLTEGVGLGCLVLHYVNSRAAHNHRTTVPQSVPTSDRYVAYFSECFLFNLMLQLPYISRKLKTRNVFEFIKRYQFGRQVVVRRQYGVKMSYQPSRRAHFSLFVYVFWLQGARIRDKHDCFVLEKLEPFPKRCWRFLHCIIAVNIERENNRKKTSIFMEQKPKHSDSNILIFIWIYGMLAYTTQ